MAENITSEKKGKTVNRKQKSTSVDLTPMVDLGFLLITFFVFTTTMATPKAMGMITPDDKDTTRDLICESCAITIIPAANNKLLWYTGSENSAVNRNTDYSASGLRLLLSNKKKETDAAGKEAILIIKPGNFSSFKNLIDIIDESNITMYKRYYLDKLSEADMSNIE